MQKNLTNYPFDILKLLLGIELDQKLKLSDSLEYLTIKNLNYESIDITIQTI